MILNKVSLTNIGVFSGTHSIALNPGINPEKPRPVILIGGMNGAGKTTILDSIKHCLYGKEVFNGNITEGGYREFLRERMHRSDLNVPASHASVELEFVYSRFGKSHSYSVKRVWEVKGKKILEELVLKKNGSNLARVPKSQWQVYMNDLVPRRMADLFLFDGEKLKDMISRGGMERFSRLLRALVGLDTIGRLQRDLKVFRSSRLQKSTDEVVRKKLMDLIQKEKDLEATIAVLKGEIAKSDEQIALLSEREHTYQRKLESEGSGFYERKGAWENQKSRLEKDLEEVADEIRQLAAGLLPIAIAGDLARQLKEALLDEQEQRRKRHAREELAQRRDSLLDEIDDWWRGEMTSQVGGPAAPSPLINLHKRVRSALEPGEYIDDEEYFGLSDHETQKLVSNIDKALNDVPDQLEKLTQKYESIECELKSVTNDLSQVPEQGILKPMLDKHNEMLQNLAILKANLEDKHERLDKLQEALGFAQKNREKVEEEAAASSHMDRMEMVGRIHQVLDEFASRMPAEKLTKVENEFMETFRLLNRKQDLIHKIKIDPSDMELTLLDSNGREITPQSLSSGEQEIFALSFLWAMARVSGYPFPFLVDTPLARLDSEHRSNLVDNFFPHASHQLILFSTNEEIDMGFYKNLSESIQRAYLLEFNEEKKQSTIQEGYFWQ